MRNLVTTKNAIIMGIHRLPSSVMGNPRYQLVLEREDGTLLGVRTMPDSALAYEIGNFKEGQKVDIEHKLRYGYETLENIEKAEP